MVSFVFRGKTVTSETHAYKGQFGNLVETRIIQEILSILGLVSLSPSCLLLPYKEVKIYSVCKRVIVLE